MLFVFVKMPYERSESDYKDSTIIRLSKAKSCGGKARFYLMKSHENALDVFGANLTVQ